MTPALAAAPDSVAPPSFGSLPDPPARRPLVFSSIAHLLLFILVPYFGILIPLAPQVKVDTPEDIIADNKEEPLVFPRLPGISSRGSGGAPGGHPAAIASSVPPLKTANLRPEPSPAKPVLPDLPKTIYTGPQVIISNPPDANNVVQTVRRPDIPDPPKLDFPVRLQPMVVLPPPRILTKTPPRLQKQAPQPAAPEPIVPMVATVENPALPVLASQAVRVEAAPAPPKKEERVELAPNDVPPSRATDPNSTAKKAVVVVNAVPVPPDSRIAVPDAENAGSFAVMPRHVESSLASGAPVAGNTPNGSTNSAGHGSAAGTSTGGGPDPNAIGSGQTSGSGTGPGTSASPGSGTGTGTQFDSGTGNGTGSGPGAGSDPAGRGNGSGAGIGTGPGKAPGAGSGPTGNSGVPGLTIIGGSAGRGGSRLGAMPQPRTGYGITIISGGSSGGASRDVGIFSRNETVYTVYISMADAGGGPSWSMQYASASAGSVGILAPAVAQKKVPAIMAQSEGVAPSSPVQIAGMIDETGKPQSLRSIRGADAASAAAIRALEQWHFEPAQLEGKPVALKVLIGVVVRN